MMKWMAIFLLVTSATALAETELKFHLCPSYVQQSAVGEQTDSGWPVFVKLTELGTTNFEAFTEAYSGRMIRIVVSSREFTRATIWVPIVDGNLHGTFSSQQVAMDWQKTLASRLPAAPCGARH
jgi:preprotein translocase subunit SecD